MTTLAVGLVQMEIADGQASQNLQRAVTLIGDGPAADLYLLPELWSTGYARDRWRHSAETETPGLRLDEEDQPLTGGLQDVRVLCLHGIQHLLAFGVAVAPRPQESHTSRRRQLDLLGVGRGRFLRPTGALMTARARLTAVRNDSCVESRRLA